MKTNLLKNTLMIAAIIVFVTVNSAFAQVELKPDPTQTYELIETSIGDNASIDDEIQIYTFFQDIKLHFPKYDGTYDFVVSDVTGKMIYAGSVNANDNTDYVVSLKNVSSQIIIVSVYGNNTRKSAKLFVSK